MPSSISPAKRGASLRFALRLQKLAAASSRRLPAIATATFDLLTRMHRLAAVHRLYQLAHARQWHQACRHLLAQQAYQLRDLAYVLSGVDYTQAPSNFPICARNIVQDLQALDDEFADFSISSDLNVVSVVTEPITLCDIPLGRFRIELNIAPLNQGRIDGSVLAAIALDPHPAAGHDDVTHPHVQAGGICLGEGAEPVRRALAEGRLYDVFVIVRQILLNYNEASPYASLDTWSGRSCDDCERVVNEDELYSCNDCGDSVCSRCDRSCADCDQTYCRSCLHNTDSGDLVCSECLATRDAEAEDAEAEENDDEHVFADPDSPTPEQETPHVHTST